MSFSAIENAILSACRALVPTAAFRMANQPRAYAKPSGVDVAILLLSSQAVGLTDETRRTWDGTGDVRRVQRARKRLVYRLTAEATEQVPGAAHEALEAVRDGLSYGSEAGDLLAAGVTFLGGPETSDSVTVADGRGLASASIDLAFLGVIDRERASVSYIETVDIRQKTEFDPSFGAAYG